MPSGSLCRSYFGVFSTKKTSIFFCLVSGSAVLNRVRDCSDTTEYNDYDSSEEAAVSIAVISFEPVASIAKS